MATTNELKRMSARLGRAFWEGEEITSMIKFNAVFTPEVTKKRVVGQMGMTSKVIGHDITGEITQFKNTQAIRNLIAAYQKTGSFPKIQLQAVVDDSDSDYFDDFGEDRIQLVNVQLTGDLPLIDIDAEGEEITETIAFNAADVRFL